MHNYTSFMQVFISIGSFGRNIYRDEGLPPKTGGGAGRALKNR
jgi:hypothetical protein